MSQRRKALLVIGLLLTLVVAAALGMLVWGPPLYEWPVYGDAGAIAASRFEKLGFPSSVMRVKRHRLLPGPQTYLGLEDRNGEWPWLPFHIRAFNIQMSRKSQGQEDELRLVCSDQSVVLLEDCRVKRAR